jgi:hypothetical protein
MNRERTRLVAMLIGQLTQAGVRVRRNGDKLAIEPADRVPSAIIPILVHHKWEIMGVLAETRGPDEELAPTGRPITA